MKQTILDKILYKILFEQTKKELDGITIKGKKTTENPISVTNNDTFTKRKSFDVDADDKRKRVVIKTASDLQYKYAVRSGALQAFKVVLVVKSRYKDDITDSNIVELVQQAISNNPDVGIGSKYDNGNYIYVTSVNQSANKIRQVYNVWIINYAELLAILKSIQTVETQNGVSNSASDYNINRFKWFEIGKIPVLQYKDAVQWISLLKTKSKEYNLDLRSIRRKPYTFVDLTYINKRPVEVDEIKDIETVTIKSEDDQLKYALGNFTGTVEVRTLSDGKLSVLKIEGTDGYSLTSGENFEFTGKFKNNYPDDGLYKFYDNAGNIVKIWDGSLKYKSYDPPQFVFNKKLGKWITSGIKYPYTTDRYTLIYNSQTNNATMYTLPDDDNVYFGIPASESNNSGYWYSVLKSDFEYYILVNSQDDEDKNKRPEPTLVTDETIKQKLNKLYDSASNEEDDEEETESNIKTADTEKKNEYPREITWLSIDVNNKKIHPTVYKLTDDTTNVYFHDTVNTWRSMNLTDFETYDKLTNTEKQKDKTPKQTVVTDTNLLQKLNKLIASDPTDDTKKPEPKPKPKPDPKPDPKPEPEPKKQWLKPGELVIPIPSVINVYELRSNKFIKQTTRLKSSITHMKVKFYSKNHLYLYVDFEYNNGEPSETYWVLTSDVKKK